MAEPPEPLPEHLGKLPQVKLCLVGSSSVGKSTLTQRFRSNTFVEGLKPTIAFEFATKTVSIKESESILTAVSVTLWDTAGQERYGPAMPIQYLRNSHGVVFVFDVTSRKSFEAVKERWLKLFAEHSPTALKMLVGNKIDSDARDVSQQEATLFARHNGCFYYDTSAKRGDNVDVAFNEFVRAVYLEKFVVGKRPGDGDRPEVALGSAPIVSLGGPTSEAASEENVPRKGTCEC
jgi:small GTP-binding protein